MKRPGWDRCWIFKDRAFYVQIASGPKRIFTSNTQYKSARVDQLVGIIRSYERINRMYSYSLIIGPIRFGFITKSRNEY